MAETIDVAQILDGNRRFAKREGLSVLEGHRAGGDNFKRLIECARDMQKIRVLAGWCLSRKNLDNRGEAEVNGIFGIGCEFLADLRDNWMDRAENKEVRLLHMGQRERMQERPMGREMLKLLDGIATHTRDRVGMIVALCFDYSGEDELGRALRAWHADGAQGDPATAYRDYLDLPRQGVPFRGLDLILRTGKEQGESHRDGAFMHPYVAPGETRVRDSELLFPEFKPQHFTLEVHAYLAEQKREGK